MQAVNRRREGDQLDKAKDDWRDGFKIADLLRTGIFTETQLRCGAYAELQIGYATYTCQMHSSAGWRLRHAVPGAKRSGRIAAGS